jgi:hypothetical protein
MELTPDDLRHINAAAAKITIEGDYPQAEAERTQR